MGKGYVAYCRQSQKQIKKLEGKEYKKYGKNDLKLEISKLKSELEEFKNKKWWQIWK